MLAAHTVLALIRRAYTKPDDSFTGTLIFLGLALGCIAFAWDGLVRRQVMLWAFPVGAAFGAHAVRIKRITAAAIGAASLLASGLFLRLAWGFFLLGFRSYCQGHASFACVGSLAGSAEAFAWVWFGGWVGWFVVVWLRMGDPRKRVLVYGVWYHQDKVAREINRRLGQQGLASLPRERLYTLEEAVLGLMRARGWLVYGEAWLDGGRKRTAITIPPEHMTQEALREPAFAQLGESERAAVALLLSYFQKQAQRAQQMSPLRRCWVGTGQRGRLGVYGRRAL